MFVPRWFLFALVGAAAAVTGWWLHTWTNASPASARSAPVAVAADVPRRADPEPMPRAKAQPVYVTVVTRGEPARHREHPQVAVVAPARRTTPGPQVAAEVAEPANTTSVGGPELRTRPVAARSSTTRLTVFIDHPVAITGSGNSVAAGRAILHVGRGGSLDANTGDTSGGAALAVAATRSSFATNGLVEPRSSRSTSLTGRIKALVTGGATPGSGGRPGISVAGGYEDHSVRVIGNDNAEEYDDSDVFVHHDGHINANTGDTDSSGLNTVDTVDSRVRSGHSIEEPADGSSAGGDGETDTGDSAAVSASDSGGDSGDQAPPPVRRGVSIGGDGFDDISLTVKGNRNVASDDDGNVVVGGRGDVNAQIGDSDTSGTVTMHTVRSDVAGGTSQ